MIGWCCVAWRHLCWKLCLFAAYVCFHARFPLAIPTAKCTHPLSFRYLSRYLSVFCCWKMTSTMRAGLRLQLVDALRSSLQHVIGSPADVCACNWISVLFFSTQLPDLWFLPHQFVADVKGRFLGCGDAFACLISAVAWTTHLSFLVNRRRRRSSGCERAR